MKSKLKQIKRETKTNTKAQKLKTDDTNSFVELDPNNKCARCQYFLHKNARSNICRTCDFELFILSTRNLSTYI